MRKTIEDLKLTKTFYHRERDAFGNRTKEPYEAQIKREVNTVTGWPRFGHYMIDAVIIAGLAFGAEFLWSLVYLSGAASNMNGVDYNFLPSAPNIIVTVAYYMICEGTMQRTIGKFATNSVVIDQYAEAPSKGALFGRSCARLVPIEAFSCLGKRGWHDRWSKTYVVKVEERDELLALLRGEDSLFINESEEILD
jgi:uncharacterized RDD family membrane protein YckC